MEFPVLDICPRGHLTGGGGGYKKEVEMLLMCTSESDYSHSYKN